MLQAQTKAETKSCFFAMKLLLPDDFVMFAGLLDFAGSDEIPNFFTNGGIGDVELAHDVFVKNGVVVVFLDIAENSGRINISESHILNSFHFFLISSFRRLFYTLLKNLSKK